MHQPIRLCVYSTAHESQLSMTYPDSPPPAVVPSSFLPHLPRSQSSFTPHLPVDILAHIAVLKELYVPPIHGGFDTSDWTDHDDEQEQEQDDVRMRKKERRFSVGLAETMDGLGLDIDTGADAGGSSSRLPNSHEIDDDDDEEEEEDEEDEEPGPHLDPFERDWAEKWLSGVVRRAQGCIEEHEDSGEALEEVREAEILLRDATAVLAMMAGTSGESQLSFYTLYESEQECGTDPYHLCCSCRLSDPSFAIPNRPFARTGATCTSTRPTLEPDSITNNTYLSLVTRYLAYIALDPAPYSCYITF